MAVLLGERVEAADAVDVHQHGGRGQAEAHGRDEALAAGQHLGVIAVLGEQGQRLVNCAGRVEVECRWDHLVLLVREQGTGDRGEKAVSSFHEQ